MRLILTLAILLGYPHGCERAAGSGRGLVGSAVAGPTTAGVGPDDRGSRDDNVRFASVPLVHRAGWVPVELDVRAQARLPERVEVAAYYVISEALTNAVKHAHASVVNVEVETVEGALRLRVRDDGVGGADPVRGSGLVGLKDRVEALGGTLAVQSPAGAGTTLRVELPLTG